MFDLVKLSPEHVRVLMQEPENAYLGDWLKSGYADQLATHPHSLAGLIDGEIMVIGGVVEQWPNRAFLWTVFSKKSKEHFVSVYRGIKKFLTDQPYRRIEMAVPIGCEIGARRALMLGFKMEVERAEAFLPSGEDCSIFSKVKPLMGVVNG